MRQLIFLALSSVLLLGCASTKDIDPVDTSTVTYKSDSADRQDADTSRIAILPVLAGQGYEGFRRRAGSDLSTQFEEQFSNAEVVSSRETRSLINDRNVSSQYSDMMESYGRTGVLQREALKTIGSAVGADFLLYSKVGAEGSERSNLVAGEYVQNTEVNQFTIYGQLWGIDEGDAVWEGTGGAAGLAEATSENTLLSMASEGVAERVLYSASEVPPPESAKSLHQKAQEKASSNYVAAYLLSSLLVIPLLLL